MSVPEAEVKERVVVVAFVRVAPAKVTLAPVSMLCGRERTTLEFAPLSVTVIWFVVPVRERSAEPSAVFPIVTKGMEEEAFPEKSVQSVPVKMPFAEAVEVVIEMTAPFRARGPNTEIAACFELNVFQSVFVR